MPRPVLASDPPGVAARRAALRLLDGVLRRGLPLEGQLEQAFRPLKLREDRALAHRLAAEVLRRLPDLDALIDGSTRQRLPDDAKARFVLRIAIAQWLRLGTPAHAAIATVLPLVDGGPRKLVHGVFGALNRAGATLPDLPNLPDAAAARWHDAWGEDVVVAARHAIAQPPPTDLTLAVAEALPRIAGQLPGDSLMPGHLRIGAGAEIPSLEGYAQGDWWVQDLGASLPARLIGPGPGTVLDLCAAPGGKTLQLAAAGWQVTAIDQSESRLARLRENLERTLLSARVLTADLRQWAPDAPADAVLLDAPCTATGIFRRHPEVLHRVRPSAVRELAEVQAALIARAADWVRPGGRLIYATCSLEPEEGEAQVEKLLAARSDYRIDPVLPDELPPGILPHPQGHVRLLPGMLADRGGIDGFFMARLSRGA